MLPPFGKGLLLVIGLAIGGLGGPANAQLTAPGRDWASITQYRDLPAQDSIFVFFADNPLGLRATLHDTLLPATFHWYRYDYTIADVTQRFTPIASHPDRNESWITPDGVGGYRVRAVSQHAPDTAFTFTAWVMVDDVQIERIDYHNSCQELHLTLVTRPSRFQIEFSRFMYFDLSRFNHAEVNRLGLEFARNIEWSSLSADVEVPEVSAFDIYINPPPLVDAAYRVTLTTPFGRTLTAQSATVQAIATSADFNIFLRERDGGVLDWRQAEGEARGEALLEVRLESTARNADSIFWRLRNDPFYIRQGADSILWRDSMAFSPLNQAFPPREWMVPGEYTVVHTAKRITERATCISTMERSIGVDTSFIRADALPNAFAPDGSEGNRLFVFKGGGAGDGDFVRSIRNFRITIFSRWGKLVYSYTGSAADWEGWDGTMGRHRDAPAGVYYYIIEAEGWDGKRFRGGRYKGFVYLFRGGG